MYTRLIPGKCGQQDRYAQSPEMDRRQAFHHTVPGRCNATIPDIERRADKREREREREREIFYTVALPYFKINLLLKIFHKADSSRGDSHRFEPLLAVGTLLASVQARNFEFRCVSAGFEVAVGAGTVSDGLAKRSKLLSKCHRCGAVIRKCQLLMIHGNHEKIVGPAPSMRAGLLCHAGPIFAVPDTNRVEVSGRRGAPC